MLAVITDTLLTILTILILLTLWGQRQPLKILSKQKQKKKSRVYDSKSNLSKFLFEFWILINSK